MNENNPETVTASDLILDMFSEEAIQRRQARGDLIHGIANATDNIGRLIAIRGYYKSMEAHITKGCRKSPFSWAISYPVDWSRIFTPIEFMAWCSIRSKGRVVLYPQYPALNYFLDFGNPGLKIGLELDGYEFHQDKEKDARRDERLNAAGWKIYRIPGFEMNRADYKNWTDYEYDMDDDEVVDHLRYWIMETGDGVIEAIRLTHFIGTEYYGRFAGRSEWVYGKYLDYCYRTLLKHQINP